MCTAVTYLTKDFYFGRTLDHEVAWPGEVTITPRNFVLPFRKIGRMEEHYAMIGMAYVVQDYPLYFDAVNEQGLAMAGLSFEESAQYENGAADRDCIAQFELIPWILAQCASVAQARQLLDRICVTGEPFSPQLPAARLHWLLADREEAAAVEVMADGIHVVSNPVGVLTNEPPLEVQLLTLRNYMHLSPQPPRNRFSEKLRLQPCSRGMGALGLPGDLSSQSRFVRAAFTKLNSLSGTSEEESVSQVFHILGTVEQTRGCCRLEDGSCEITQYTACCNVDRGIYYYTTYENRQITAVDLHREDPDGCRLTRYPLITGAHILRQNG